MLSNSLFGRSWLTNLAILMVVVATGACAFYGAQRFLQQRAAVLEQDFKARYATRAVVVAARPLTRGERLDSSAMALRQMPVKFLSSGSLGSQYVSGLAGRRLARDLARGDLIEFATLQPQRAHELSHVLAPGQRAITFGVDEINSFAGLLSTGDFIDLYYSINRDGGQSRLVLLLESVPVIATGERTIFTDTNPGGERLSGRGTFDTVTLQVAPDDAARIVLAQRSGQITAVLRNPDDPGRTRLAIRDSSTLLSIGQTQGDPTARTAMVSYIPLIVGGNGGPLAAIERMRIGAPESVNGAVVLP
jgi:pilus assembly protein CpaB